ncbi:hypothetical protein LTR91_015073 [Friedmanniomyces endolithicus]|uniref:NADH:ubiquinone oxidoreductase intermediate-associated protein 30 domain-containing protein n=2 Tax=Dothideomycetidae TaxID=451867 RepID=A0AAN6KAV7_9PEZI|nr:hypothetical protein LTR94_001508 [Friedmanniomyces endolithicus]KAK0772266.1 hypothetical protein LTR38_016946 [Friedmanniomyces endolithicus]KAK0778176.1 hypothetical protein LTR75_015725 [Friedmanniomyces endolithicus]KAK0872099.1 hypothetical protein LTR87_012563 [Friedmanniomyces endolithicus]KAK0890313.1 hypothetical protein LTR57_025157 [Friedmanniomyces endolithicus]
MASLIAGTTGKAKALDLFGGDRKWNADSWTASDDTVRGGKSRSDLEVSAHGSSARFYGCLDIKTLGGAGFASQKATGEWDLGEYVAIRVEVEKGDKFVRSCLLLAMWLLMVGVGSATPSRCGFHGISPPTSIRTNTRLPTVILKDKLLPPDPENGREQATISYEADFELPSQTIPGDTHNRTVIIPFANLNPTYRGKLKKDAPDLDTKNIKQISLMMRSFFGTQEGDFSLTLKSLTAIPEIPKQLSDTSVTDVDARKLEEGKESAAQRSDQKTDDRPGQLGRSAGLWSRVSDLDSLEVFRWD